MTMNASGPLSFGGSTLGQSINRELLQPAPYTQALSLNSSTFRALAQVPTGAISLASVYGKTYTRIGTVGGSWAAGGFVTLSITAGMPGAKFVIYGINNNGELPGNIAPYPGTLDSNGNWSNTYTVTGDYYWYPPPKSNTFYFYQGVTTQPTPLPPNTSPSSYIGQITIFSS